MSIPISKQQTNVEITERLQSRSDIANGYIVGSTPLATDWLSASIGGDPIVPANGEIYIIKTDGPYKNALFIYDSSITSYSGIDGGTVTGTEYTVSRFGPGGALSDAPLKSDSLANLYTSDSSVYSASALNIVLGTGSNIISGDSNKVIGDSNSITASNAYVIGNNNQVSGAETTYTVGHGNIMSHSSQSTIIGHSNRITASNGASTFGHDNNITSHSNTNIFGSGNVIPEVTFNCNVFGKNFDTNLQSTGSFDNYFGGVGTISKFAGQWADSNGYVPSFGDPVMALATNGSGDLLYREFAITGSSIWSSANGKVTLLDQTEPVELSNTGETVLSLTGDLVIEGNIFQNGDAYETHAEQIITTKDKITMREGALSALAAGDESGVRIKLYDGVNDAVFGVDNTGTFRVGDEFDESPLATRSESVDLVDGNILMWDESGERLIDSGVLASDVSSNSAAIASNTSDIATNTSDISSNASDIASNTSDIATNTSDISSNADAIAINTINIGGIATNAAAIASNASNISTNTTAIGNLVSITNTQTSNISSNTSNISTNASTIATKASQSSLNATNAIVSQHTSDISTNTGNISTNTTNINNNSSNISANAASIAAIDLSGIGINASNITNNTSAIDANVTAISNNGTAITTNANNIATNAANISSNVTAIGLLDTKVNSITLDTLEGSGTENAVVRFGPNGNVIDGTLINDTDNNLYSVNNNILTGTVTANTVFGNSNDINIASDSAIIGQYNELDNSSVDLIIGQYNIIGTSSYNTIAGNSNTLSNNSDGNVITTQSSNFDNAAYNMAVGQNLTLTGISAKTVIGDNLNISSVIAKVIIGADLTEDGTTPTTETVLIGTDNENAGGTRIKGYFIDHSGNGNAGAGNANRALGTDIAGRLTWTEFGTPADLALKANQADLDTTNSNVATNTSAISTNASNISTNTDAISTNAGDISNNTSAISTNASNIATNVTNINSNTTAISQKASSVDLATLQGEVDTNKGDIANNITEIGTKVEEATNDGNTYGRQGGTWVALDPGSTGAVDETSFQVTAADQDGSFDVTKANPFNNKFAHIHIMDGDDKIVQPGEIFKTDSTITLKFIEALDETLTVVLHGINKS